MRKAIHMKRTRRVLITGLLLLAGLPAMGLTIKIGSLAPVGSPWDEVLREIAAEWKRLSGGSLNVIVYGGGTVGDEPAMIRKMRVGQLDAAAMTVTGLTHVYPGVMTLQTPLLFRSDEELMYTLDRIAPHFEEQIEKKGFKVIFWTPVGWAYFFSTDSIVTPDDLKKLRYYVLEGDAEFVKVWKDMGFQPVPLATTDVLASLQSGMVEAYSATILSSLSLQWFGVANHMCDMELAPMLAVLVVSMRTWNKIPEHLRSGLEQVADRLEGALRKQTASLDGQALELMKDYGLVVHDVPPTTVDEWRSVLLEGTLRTTDRSAYDMVVDSVEEFRDQR